MELLTQNSKIKKSTVRTFNFGIPAYRDSNGFATCPFAKACVKGCYAKAGAYLFSNVAKAFQARFELTRRSEDFFKAMVTEIKRKRAERIRVHDSGDFYNPEYLQSWLDIAHASPNVQFYAYTKSIQWVKDAQARGDVPGNFTFVFSFGGKQDHLINRETDRHAWVFSSKEAMLAAGYTDTNETDDAAADPNVKKIGLVYHGTKKLENTDWSKLGEISRITKGQ